MSGFIVVLIVITIFLAGATIAAGLYFYSLFLDRKHNTQWDYSFGLLVVILLTFGWRVFIDFATRL